MAKHEMKIIDECDNYLKAKVRGTLVQLHRYFVSVCKFSLQSILDAAINGKTAEVKVRKCAFYIYLLTVLISRSVVGLKCW